MLYLHIRVTNTNSPYAYINAILASIAHGLQIERKKVCQCAILCTNFALTNDRTIEKFFTNDHAIFTSCSFFYFWFNSS